MAKEFNFSANREQSKTSLDSAEVQPKIEGRAFKDSGIEWIGQIPREWEVELIGNNIKEINDKNDDSSEDNALQFKMGSIISKKGGDSKYNPESLAAYTKVIEGDIIINGLNLSFDFISQRVGLVKEMGVITSTYLTLRPSSLLHSDFINYLFKAYDNCKAFHGMGRGLRQILAYRELKNQKLIYPLLPEQKKIADYLDKVCGEVDEMVALQETMIEELKAYKQSVITEAVTKGLNPNAPMRNSGIDWIGEIPEHWEISKLKYYINVDSGDAITSEQISDKGLYPVYGGGEIMGYFSDYNITDDYLIVGRVGARCGCVTMPNKKCWATDNALVIKSEWYKQYLFYLLDGANLNRLNTSNAQPLITATKLKNVYVPIMGLEEQRTIASYLDTKCSEIDSLIALKQAKIEELKEYKKSVIYEYVTGKKEVC